MKIILLFIFLLPAVFVKDIQAQSGTISHPISWKGIIKQANSDGTFTEFLYFDGAVAEVASGLPVFSTTIPLESDDSEITAVFDSLSFLPFTADEQTYLHSVIYDKSDVEIVTSVAIDRKEPIGVISFIPVRFNPLTGNFEKLVYFTLSYQITVPSAPAKAKTDNYADHSVLSSGSWYKIKTEHSGIHKITYSDLQSYGMDPASVNPKNIRIYGNAGGMLPEANNKFRNDDLQENAIRVVGEEDGVFNESDYILFFGMSPHVWGDVLGFFTYYVNYYDDYNYYFITTSLGQGLRLSSEESLNLNPTQTVTKYNDYQVVEDEEVNLIQSGKKWYGDIFGEINERDYSFSFPNVVESEPVIIKTEVANRSFANEQMALRVNNDLNDTMILTLVTAGSTKFAQKKKKTLNYYTGSEDIQMKFTYLPSTSSSIAWLDYIMVNVQRQLIFGNSQIMFRQLSTVQEGAISKFIISNANAELEVWDITNPIIPVVIEPQSNAGELVFTVRTDSLREFIAFDGSLYYSPEFVSAVQNQDLHSGGPFDMVIVTHPLFLSQANEVAEIHRTNDHFTVNVAVIDQIYNEFSSGKQDPAAIRDYLKMLYDKFDEQELRFLLLFGDGSFDPKDRYENNTNFIPAFQNEESWVTASSMVIDDFYGYLDETEGADGVGQVDIGIGRIPVHNTADADIAVAKIKRYLTKAEPVFGEWRSRICIIADDEDGNLHLEQADSLANGFVPDEYNIQKIYFDTYKQVKTPSGYRYPEVNEAINEAVNSGKLILNYAGHGGKSGWAHEKVLGVNDIQNWSNSDNLPVFITATCEFSRFDEPELFTGGEMTFLNQNGGAIALFTTTRLAYANSNFTVNQRALDRTFNLINGERPYLGDIIKYSKPPSQLTTRNFILMGDPALRLAYPEYEVRTNGINNHSYLMVTDTLRALDKVTVKGEITDSDGNKISGFNGKTSVMVFDKPTKYSTLGNDATSYLVDYYCQDKIIWSGKSTVTNGDFEFTFIVPKDISYNYGAAKISYYAVSDTTDALGYDNEIIIGGFNPDAISDIQGPVIDLYLNDLSFVSGDQTHANPVLLAFLEDESGINVSEGGIGHGITIVLDDDQTNEILLNDYYIQQQDSYQKGSVSYPFHDLPDGLHTLTLKAWDNYNNSSEKTIEFVINQGADLTLTEVKNYPNPFSGSTTFLFKHTRPGDKLEINLEIFDPSGRLILSFQKSLEAELTSIPFFVWDGTDSKGNQLRSGVYLYTLRVKDQRGEVSVQRQKLVLMN